MITMITMMIIITTIKWLKCEFLWCESPALAPGLPVLHFLVINDDDDDDEDDDDEDDDASDDD